MEILFYSSEDDSFGAFSILFFLLFKFSFSLFVTPPPPPPPTTPTYDFIPVVLQRKILNL